jgi:hypothetical protein
MSVWNYQYLAMIQWGKQDKLTRVHLSRGSSIAVWIFLDILFISTEWRQRTVAHESQNDDNFPKNL